MKILEILGKYMICGVGAWIVTVLVMVIYCIVEILKNERLVEYVDRQVNMLNGGDRSAAYDIIVNIIIWPVYIPIVCGQITELFGNAKEQMARDTLSQDN